MNNNANKIWFLINKLIKENVYISMINKNH